MTNPRDKNPINPTLAAEADGWDPTTLIAGSGQKVWWRCEQGHRWQAKNAMTV